jgi:hypothetical protein
VTTQHDTEWDSREIDGSNLTCCTWMFPINSAMRSGGVNAIPRFPRVVLNSKTFPFDQILQFPIDHLAIQNFFHYSLFFSIHNFWRWQRFWMLPQNGVRQSRSKFDDVKDRMQTAHGSGEFQMIGTVTNLLDYFKRTQMMMRQFFGWSSCLDVTCIKVHLVSGLVVRCWSTPPIIISCHIVLESG